MSAVVRLKVLPKYPANTVGEKFISITKVNGIYTIDVDYTLLASVPILSPSTSFIAVYDAAAGSYKNVSLQDLLTAASLIPQEPTVVTGASATIAAGTQAVAISRAAPATTALALPTVASQAGVPLRIIDWSTAVTGHAITITPNGSETIEHNATLVLNSNAAQLSSVTLRPSNTLSGWYIAP